jgi:hypothetical protein
MSRFLPVGKDAAGAARFLLAALPALGALLTALAITGDLVGRMARNHPHATFAAFGSAAVAVFLGAVAAFGFKAGSEAERRILYSGLVVLGCSLVFAVYAGVATWGDRPLPSIAVTPKGSTVSVSVRDSGLRSSDHVVLEVEQLVRSNANWKSGRPLYGASLGPDAAGEVNQTVDLHLPAGEFDDLGARAWVGDEPRKCYGRGNTTGCVRVHIPHPQERPQLAASWETFVRAPRLLVALKARNLAQRPPRSIVLRVYGIAPDGLVRNLAEWSLAPDADGVFNRRVAIVVGHAFSDVCVVATTSTADPHCPPTDDVATVWLRLAVPPLQ